MIGIRSKSGITPKNRRQTGTLSTAPGRDRSMYSKEKAVRKQALREAKKKKKSKKKQSI